MWLRFTIVLVLWSVSLALPAWADGQAGVDAYKRDDYATALREWRPLAEQGDAGAQFYLGTLYAFGRGVPQDYAMARQWYGKAAAQGDVRAQNNLGTLYRDGQGGPQDYATARQWFEKAAAHGVAEPQYNLGLLYVGGQGGPQDYTKARQWFEKSAVQGHAGAQYNLGTLYRDGQGGRRTIRRRDNGSRKRLPKVSRRHRTISGCCISQAAAGLYDGATVVREIRSPRPREGAVQPRGAV